MERDTFYRARALLVISTATELGIITWRKAIISAVAQSPTVRHPGFPDLTDTVDPTVGVIRFWLVQLIWIRFNKFRTPAKVSATVDGFGSLVLGHARIWGLVWKWLRLETQERKYLMVRWVSPLLANSR